MIVIERQFQIALNLVETADTNILIVCKHAQSFLFVQAIKEFCGTYNSKTKTYTAPSGGTIRLLDFDHNDPYAWAGFQFTHVIVNESIRLSGDEERFVVSRLRSAKYKGDLQFYYPYGLVASYRSYS